LPDTYDKRCQLGASRRRFEDADALHNCNRWSGAIYMGGYAIECSLKALICDQENKNNFKDTSMFQQGLQGKSLHNLSSLFNAVPSLQRTVSLDRTNKYQNAWNTIVSMWKNDELRYSNMQGDEKDSTKFIESVKLWHKELLIKQGEAS
jgi:phosphopantetheinyl transferase (holo-ACP synthase)